MKYWSYFCAKLAVAGGLLWAVWLAIMRWIPEPDTFLYYRVGRLQDLRWTLVIFGFALLCVGAAYLIVLDQQHRCRVCLRRLRMPVNEGSWGYSLLRPPRTESICPFGHGTLDEPEIHLEGTIPTKWKQHGDIWEELERYEDVEGKRR